ncbi:hypothetical protein RUM43_000027 [Polyplax serrata]|uniref:Uncharacterized protein n=1 Tax=Polyplax serrata TaxID=468196 RepID=A0AAN8XMV0_POLSC
MKGAENEEGDERRAGTTWCGKENSISELGIRMDKRRKKRLGQKGQGNIYDKNTTQELRNEFTGFANPLTSDFWKFFNFTFRSEKSLGLNDITDMKMYHCNTYH